MNAPYPTQKSEALLFFERLEAEGLTTNPRRNGVARGIETITNDADMKLLYEGYQDWLRLNSQDPAVRTNPSETAQNWMLEYARIIYNMAYTPNFRWVFGQE
ncbi:MAG: hypothetical protein EPN86_03940 [Nanoarchaeota archaeon]|nr:MAG: hypothetical protein EPN86_03940 [Nanoarchaeota archaeon]